MLLGPQDGRTESRCELESRLLKGEYIGKYVGFRV